jgi:hypothetical protein
VVLLELVSNRSEQEWSFASLIRARWRASKCLSGDCREIKFSIKSGKWAVGANQHKFFLGRVYRVRNSAATASSFGGGRLVLEKDDTRKQILTQ